jgi:membrane protease YdiL (CAAX protease family)
LLALVALTGVLLGIASQSRGTQPDHHGRPASDVVLAGDVFYRLGEFVQQQSQAHPDSVAWYAGYLLSQRGLGIWERQALTAAPDPEALLRLGIVYSRSGYREQGAEMLGQALKGDPAHGSLYLALLRLYGGEKQPRGELLGLPDLLTGGAHWVRDLVAVDLYAAGGTATQAGQAAALWQAHLNRFGLVMVLVWALAVLLALAGGVLFLHWLVRRVVVVSPRRWRAPLQVPWGLWEVTEVFTVTIFLMVLVTVGSNLLPAVRGVLQGDGVLAPLALLVAYCLYMGLALLLAWRRAARAPRPWRLLGLRRVAPGGVWRPALRTYALLLFCLAPIALYASHRYLAVTSAIFRGTETPAAYVVYFVLICVIAPVVEELLFRGFLYAGLRGLFTPGWAALVSAFAFAGAHLPTPGPAVLIVLALGFVLALLYENTRSIVPGMIVHALHNTLIFAIMFAVIRL